MLEMGLTPFSSEVRKFTDLHWMVFFSLIELRNKRMMEKIVEMLGIGTGDGFVPLSVVINPEVGMELAKRREAWKLKKEMEEELEEFSVDELKYMLNDIEKIVKEKEK